MNEDKKEIKDKSGVTIGEMLNMPHLKILVPGGVAKSRMAICKQCEHLGKLNMCALCKCIMPAKTSLVSSTCPAGKWGMYVKPVKPEGF